MTSKLREVICGYLFPGFIGAIGGAVGIAGGLSSLFGGSGNGSASNGYGSGVPFYSAPQADLGAANNGLIGLIQQARGATNGLSSQVDPALLSSLYQSMGINYGGLQQAGQQAGQQSTMAGQNAMQAGQGLQQGANSILGMAFDPQNALFNQQTQQLTDQTNAAEAARGLGNSQAGASILGNTLGNFDINWQNQQLGRAESGLGAAGQASGQGQALQSMAPGLTYQGGQLPLQANQTAAAAPGQAASTYASQLGNSLQPLESQYSGIQSYLNGNNSAAGAAAGAFQNQQGFNAGQQTQGMQGLLSGLTGFGNSSTGQQAGNWLSSLFGSGGGSAASSLGPMGFMV